MTRKSVKSKKTTAKGANTTKGETPSRPGSIAVSIRGSVAGENEPEERKS